MASSLRHVDPTRRRGVVYRTVATLSTTRGALAFSRLVSWRIDPWLLARTGGRVSTAMAMPVGLLETTGARTGAARRHGVIYFHDGDAVTIVASLAGAPHHPAWFHNLVAHPDVTFGGVAMRATVVDDEVERARLWQLADNVFAPFATYRARAAATGRTIPIVQLRAAPAVSPR